MPLPEAAQRRAEERDAAGPERDQPEDRADQGGLARAVGAQDRHHLAGRDAEGDVTQDGAVAVSDHPVRDVHDVAVTHVPQPSAGPSTARFFRITEK
ncbi:hypothetical protein Psuf_016920 [Phytohabitans suffuscus]|uniref:Uncharacterized protein n=1 Tax=Phytohabitans suffuscus TaxID=624315 RepID=A0A6F8YED5_9ACTN|nr:hypothetical protein Psuf_016920 [Phytohabitans suffuscus]